MPPTVDAPPLVVDLDGTLTPVDTLHETLIAAVKAFPSTLLALPLLLLRGRAHLKAVVASRALESFDASLLPYRTELLVYLRDEKARGRRIVLATAAHASVAQAVAIHLGLFDAVIASDRMHNLKGRAKLAAIQATEGARFVYVGDSAADLPIWQAAQGAILAGASARLGVRARSAGVTVELEFAQRRADAKEWLRALRVHQWLKNLLLFVPLLTAFAFADLPRLGAVLVGFAAFCLAASATYICNDLWDLQYDRRHPRKRDRPFAAGRIPLATGLLVAGALMTTALLLAATQSSALVSLLLVYIAMTSAYSWVLKSYILIDVLLLALLYTLRIVAGSVAAGVSTSLWLLGFSVFIFLSLALIKRCAELIALERTGGRFTGGRDYRVGDLVVLWPMGVGAGLSAVVVFALFASAPEVAVRYATPQLLWLVALGLIYWLGRLWIKTARGEMDDDPLIYAMRDFGSRASIGAMLLIVLAARFMRLA